MVVLFCVRRSSPKSVSLDQVAQLLIHYETACDKGRIKVQSFYGTSHALQVLQHVFESLSLPSINVVVDQSIVHIIACTPSDANLDLIKSPPSDIQPHSLLVEGR